jgi:hypothetical protein
MDTMIRAAVTALLAGVAWAAVGVAPGLTDPPADEPIKDRAGFIPLRKTESLKGTAVGVLVYDAQPVLSSEGRSGPGDQLCFSANGNSYRWVYVPVTEKPRISNLRVPVGDKENAQFVVFPALDMASPRTVAPWGVTSHYTLVEVEVNNGLGSPKNDSFVATKMKVLEGTNEYPLRTADVIKALKERYAAHVKGQGKATDSALTEAQKKALKDGKATGPREQAELMYVTWLPQAERLRVHFRTKITDGQYTYIEIPDRRLPPPPLKLPDNGKLLNDQVPPPPPPPPPGQVGKVQPPPPPLKRRFKTGVSFGIEFGMAYEVDKAGKLVRTQGLPIESFEHRLPPLPGILPPGRPNPLPAPPPPVIKE